jgi:TetR/AcrR family transcriptional regulator
VNQPVEPAADRILVEATRLFAANGVAGTSVQAIAGAAGVSKPTLLYHFGTKEGLHDAVIDAVVVHWTAELPRLMTAAAEGGPRVDALLEAFFAFFRRDPARARLLLREALDRPEALADRLRRDLAPWTGLLAQAVRMGQGAGQLRAEVDAPAYIVLVIAAALGVVALAETAGAMVSPSPSLGAQQAELVRVARTALLSPRLQEP